MQQQRSTARTQLDTPFNRQAIVAGSLSRPFSPDPVRTHSHLSDIIYGSAPTNGTRTKPGSTSLMARVPVFDRDSRGEN